MKNDMTDILRSIDIDVVPNKKEKVSKLFGNGKPIGIMLGEQKARFVPSNNTDDQQKRV